MNKILVSRDKISTDSDNILVDGNNIKLNNNLNLIMDKFLIEFGRCDNLV